MTTMSTDAPLLSVIIPVYKVEKYLEQCVNSVLTQTYSNLQIILVDDGSPDSCPKICEHFSMKDKRISVVHQKNQGLSQARNTGIEIALGEFITFLDSDDYLEKDTYACMMKILLQYKCSIVASGIQTFEDGTTPPRDTSDFAFTIYGRLDALKIFLYENSAIDVVACNKIYRRELFNNIRYPKGRTFEDFVPTTKLILASNKVAYIVNRKYYYRQRKNSINGANFKNTRFNKHIWDLDAAITESIDLIVEFDQNLEKYVMPAGLKRKISIYNQMVKFKCIRKDYEMQIQRDVWKNVIHILWCNYLNIEDKTKLLLIQIPLLYRFIYRLYLWRKK